MKNLKIILLAVLIFGCKTTQKSTSSSKTDSVNVHKTDSVKTAAKDSSVTKKIDSTVTKTKDSSVTQTIRTENGLTINFDTTKKQTSVKPIIITQKGDSTIIDPGGRDVSSVNKTGATQNENKNTVKGSENTNVKKADSSGVKTADSTGLRKADSTRSLKDEKIKQKDKSKPTAVLWWVLLCIAAVFGLVYLFGNYKISLKLTPPFLTFTKKLK